MLGGLLALLSGAAFAFNTAGIRRGVLTGTVGQAMAITVPIGVPIFFVVALLTGYLGSVMDFTWQAQLALATSGVVNFVWARYCLYRATQAIGMNLAAPLQQINLVVTLILAVLILGEQINTLRALGIVLVFLGPAITLRQNTNKDSKKKSAPATSPDKNGAAAPAGAAVEKKAAPATPIQPEFKPNYAEGYVYSLLSTIGYGVTPILVRYGLGDRGLGIAIAGGFNAYVAATIAMALVLLWPGQIRHVLAVKPQAALWFSLSGVLVCLSQMLLYLAMSIAPVSVVLPISRLSILFRLLFSGMLNKDYEIFGGKVYLGTIISLVGALLLSVSTGFVLSLLPHSDGLSTILQKHWP